MRLHTDKINSEDIYAAASEAGVSVVEAACRGSRSRARAFSVYLSGSSNRWSNGREHKAATWDEWGMFMSALYRIDPNAMWGSKSWGYKDAGDFDFQTGDRFVNIPSDLHTQHKWAYDYENSQPFSGVITHKCNGCSAVRNYRR